MAGLAEPIRLREFTNRHPQLRIEDVHPGKAPLCGKTMHGLYVGQVGRRLPADPNEIKQRPHFDQSIPENLGLPPMDPGPYNPHSTTYGKHFITSYVPIDLKYTPTSHFEPLPVGAKSPPYIPAVNHPSWP